MSQLARRNPIAHSSLLLSALIAAGAVTAAAAPIVDGRVDVAEGYSHQAVLAPSRAAGTGPAATVLLAQDELTDDLFLAFVFPTDCVDNSYGDNAVGWVHPPHHRFKDLLNSDLLELRLDLADQTVLQVTLDYLAKVGCGYDSGLVGDGGIALGEAGWVKAAASSLDYNLNVLAGGWSYRQHSPETDSAYTPNPSLPGWRYDVAYEMQISGQVFAGGGRVLGPEGLAGGLEIVVLNAHASPSKNGDQFEDVPVSVLGPVPIPEPGALALLGLGGLLAFLRRRGRS